MQRKIAIATTGALMVAIIGISFPAASQQRFPNWYDVHGSMFTYNPVRGDPGPGNGPYWQGEPADRLSVWRRGHYRGNDPDNGIRRQLMRDR